MTKLAPVSRTRPERCEHCAVPIAARTGPGRPRRFCSGRCRQAHWVASQRADELRLTEDELVAARSALERLQDQVFVVSRAVQDVDRDLGSQGAGSDPRQLDDALRWLLDAVRPLCASEPARPERP